ncbi:hypothetical protein KC19_11G070100 [Ceratodon purpureus]|uniref:Secreted protein n=1 Tax=Ceratodon purpureus TaxID=3225 RepID=A0A8T0GE97_CERPU|nr:hypothetical protein KC19_11G070100 [Ceratodon purpureus]
MAPDRCDAGRARRNRCAKFCAMVCVLAASVSAAWIGSCETGVCSASVLLECQRGRRRQPPRHSPPLTGCCRSTVGGLAGVCAA